MRSAVCLLIGLGLSACPADAQAWQTDGNVKYSLLNTAYPGNSVLNDLFGDNATDHTVSTRFNVKRNSHRWSIDASYELIGRYGDAVTPSAELSGGVLRTPAIATDDARLFDLTSTIDRQDDRALVHRLDRFSISYQDTHNVVKIGRQAVSWGNGLIYTPMDFFNPFDPTAIDTEYKTGDDMVYAQRLLDNGDDLQLVWVARRDQAQRSSGDVNSLALKYHGFAGTAEVDLLFAKHYQDTVIGLGLSGNVGGSVIRGDWVSIDTGQARYHNVVTNISYSWVAYGKNMSGSLEYFHNAFGLTASQVNLPDILSQPDLLERLDRGELFTVGKEYLAGSVTVEIAPLWNVSKTVFHNASDNSALLQLVSLHDLSQNSRLTLSVSVPIGPKNTEFGGIAVAETVSGTRFADADWSLFGQWAWYF